MTIQIVDSFAEEGCKTSRFLTRDELKPIKPDYPQSRMNFIFKHEIPLEVESGIGKLLLDKFDEVDYVQKEKSYEEMEYTKLKEIAIEKGVNAHFVKKDVLIDNLKKAD